jgi:hypothetical protein
MVGPGSSDRDDGTSKARILLGGERDGYEQSKPPNLVTPATIDPNAPFHGQSLLAERELRATGLH